MKKGKKRIERRKSTYELSEPTGSIASSEEELIVYLKVKRSDKNKESKRKRYRSVLPIIRGSLGRNMTRRDKVLYV